MTLLPTKAYQGTLYKHTKVHFIGLEITEK